MKTLFKFLIVLLICISVSAQPVNKTIPDNSKIPTISDFDKIRCQIQKMLWQAQKDKDIVKVICLNDKLSQANAIMAMFKDHPKPALFDRQKSILVEALGCVGESDVFFGDLAVSVDVGFLPTMDEPGDPERPDVRPPEASGSK